MESDELIGQFVESCTHWVIARGGRGACRLGKHCMLVLEEGQSIRLC
jgi:hypothetical protein